MSPHRKNNEGPATSTFLFHGTNAERGNPMKAIRGTYRSTIRRLLASYLAVLLVGFGSIGFAFDEGLGGFVPEQNSSETQQTSTVTSTGGSAGTPANQSDSSVHSASSQSVSSVSTLVTSLINFLDALANLFNEIGNIISATGTPPASTTEPRTPATTGGTQRSPAPVTPTKPAQANLGVDSAELNAWKGGKLPPEKFVRLIGPAAKQSMARTGVPASVTIAQAALETGWGGSTIGNAKNLFGIKGTGPAGSVSKPTREYINGRYVTVQGTFRAYNTWSESIDDHSKLLQKDRYRPAMAYKDNPDMFAAQLQRCGYATDPSYAKKLVSIMKTWNLYQYDT